VSVLLGSIILGLPMAEWSVDNARHVIALLDLESRIWATVTTKTSLRVPYLRFGYIGRVN
jgi:hypothetical protein